MSCPTGAEYAIRPFVVGVNVGCFLVADLLKCPNLPTLPSAVINNLNIVRTESHSVKNHAQAIERDSALNATSLSATSPELKLTEGI